MSAFEPFRIEVPQADVDDLRARLSQARIAQGLPGTGWSRGVPADYLAELVRYWRDGFEAASAVNIGVGIAVRGGGLVSPAIHAVDTLALDEVMQRLLDLVNRARSGHLRGSELSDGTITITNLGDLGVTSVHGVIYPPQVALVGFGRIAERPWAVDGMLGVRPIVTATLSADHRASTGHQGGAFLSAIDDLLQHPEAL